MSGSAPRGTSKYEALLHSAIDRRGADLHFLNEGALRDKLGVEELIKEEAHRRLDDILPSEQRQMTFERRDSVRVSAAARASCMLRDTPDSRRSLDNASSLPQPGTVTLSALANSRRSLDSTSVAARRRSSAVVYSNSLTTALEEGDLMAALASQGSVEAPRAPRTVPSSLIMAQDTSAGSSPNATSPSSPAFSRGQNASTFVPSDQPQSLMRSRRASAVGLSGAFSLSSPNKFCLESPTSPLDGSSKSLMLDSKGSPTLLTPQAAAKSAGRLFGSITTSRSSEKAFGAVGNAAQCAAARAQEAKQQRRKEVFTQDDVMSRLSRWGDGKRLEDD